MAFIEPAPGQAEKGIGTITIVKLLTPAELDGKCDMYAKVIVPPSGQNVVVPAPISTSLPLSL